MQGLSHSPVVPPSLSAHKCGASQSTTHCLTRSASHCLACQLLPCSTWLPISAPPTSLDECFFFNSLVVALPYNSIFWQFWLFFVFKFVVALFLVVRGGTVSAYTSILAGSLDLNSIFLILVPWKETARWRDGCRGLSGSVSWETYLQGSEEGQTGQRERPIAMLF